MPCIIQLASHFLSYKEHWLVVIYFLLHNKLTRDRLHVPLVFPLTLNIWQVSCFLSFKKGKILIVNIFISWSCWRRYGQTCLSVYYIVYRSIQCKLYSVYPVRRFRPFCTSATAFTNRLSTLQRLLHIFSIFNHFIDYSIFQTHIQWEGVIHI